MPNLEPYLHEGWTITFEFSGNSTLPYLCTCTRTIDTISPTIYRRALGTAAGATCNQALGRALAFAETNEAATIEIYTRSEPTTPMLNILATLGLDKPDLPANKPRRL